MKTVLSPLFSSALDVECPSVFLSVLGSYHMVQRGSSLDQITDDVSVGGRVVLG